MGTTLASPEPSFRRDRVDLKPVAKGAKSGRRARQVSILEIERYPEDEGARFPARSVSYGSISAWYELEKHECRIENHRDWSGRQLKPKSATVISADRCVVRLLLSEGAAICASTGSLDSAVALVVG